MIDVGRDHQLSLFTAKRFATVALDILWFLHSRSCGFACVLFLVKAVHQSISASQVLSNDRICKWKMPIRLSILAVCQYDRNRVQWLDIFSSFFKSSPWLLEGRVLRTLSSKRGWSPIFCLIHTIFQYQNRPSFKKAFFDLSKTQAIPECTNVWFAHRFFTKRSSKLADQIWGSDSSSKCRANRKTAVRRRTVQVRNNEKEITY